MRIARPKERWFKVPNDADMAAVKIKQLSPGERQDIIDKAFDQKIIYRPDKDNPGKMVPIMSQKTNTRYDREETIVKSIVNWKNFFERDGKTTLPCTRANIIRAIREIDGFAGMVTDFRTQLDNDIEAEEKDLEKNLPNASSDGLKNRVVSDAKS